jgi:hypothetical protein
MSRHLNERRREGSWNHIATLHELERARMGSDGANRDVSMISGAGGKGHGSPVAEKIGENDEDGKARTMKED